MRYVLMLNSKAFSLIETLVAAAVIAVAVLSVVAVVRKGQEYMWVNLHRRTARAILDTTLEGARFYPGNYGSIPATIASDSVVLDATNGKPKAQRSFSITSGTVDVVAYKSITVKLLWQEYAGAAADSVMITRRVPDIPDSLQNIAPFADTIKASDEYSDGTRPASNVVDGIRCLLRTGDWSVNNSTSPWIRLAWKQNHRIKKIVLYDRCAGGNYADQATVSFSDGSPNIIIAIPENPNCGSAIGSIICTPGTAVFGSKYVSWINIQLNGRSADGFNHVGLAEIEVYE